MPFSVLLNVYRMWRELKSFSGYIVSRYISDITLHLHLQFEGETFSSIHFNSNVLSVSRKRKEKSFIFLLKKLSSREKWINFAVNSINPPWLCSHLSSQRFPVKKCVPFYPLLIAVGISIRWLSWLHFLLKNSIRESARTQQK